MASLFSRIPKVHQIVQNSARMSSSCSAPGPVAAAIQSKLTECLAPVHVEVINESYMHNVPKGSETHFKVVVVSPEFNEVRKQA